MYNGMWVYYSLPEEGANALCVFDMSPSSWEQSGADGKHMELRKIFPGSIIHCRPHNENSKSFFKKYHTGIRYHAGER